MSVTAARGFTASGVYAGVRKKPKADLALILSDREASAAAVFTRNLVQAAPIGVCRTCLERSGGRARAVVVNAGNANACTGPAGERASWATVEAAAAQLGLPPEQVLVASTGVIGQQLPFEKLVAAMPEAAAGLSPEGGIAAADAILTTDTRRKESVRVVETAAGRFTVGGMAKGSGMIHPDMATTLGFVTSDAAVEPSALQAMLSRAIERSFNRVTVDGDTSTNDMVALLANGASGVEASKGAEAEAFEAALTEVLVELARMVAADGEGATRLVTVRVTGARDEQDALAISRTISGSPLVKTAVHGNDANWGRIVAAAGRAGVALEPEALTVKLNGLAVLEPGYRSSYSEEEATELLKREEVVIEVDLGAGPAQATTWTCDLSKDYVDINASYRS